MFRWLMARHLPLPAAIHGLPSTPSSRDVTAVKSASEPPPVLPKDQVSQPKAPVEPPQGPQDQVQVKPKIGALNDVEQARLQELQQLAKTGHASADELQEMAGLFARESDSLRVLLRPPVAPVQEQPPLPEVHEPPPPEDVPLKGDLDQIPDGLEGSFTRALKTRHESENVTAELQALRAKIARTGYMPSEEDMAALNKLTGGELKVTTKQGTENLKQLVDGALDTILKDDHQFLERVASQGTLPGTADLQRLNVLIEGDKNKELIGKLQERLGENADYQPSATERLHLKGLIDIARARASEGLTHMSVSELDFDYTTARKKLGEETTWAHTFENCAEKILRAEDAIESYPDKILSLLEGGLDGLADGLHKLGIDADMGGAITGLKTMNDGLQSYRQEVEDVRAKVTGSGDLPTESQRVKGTTLQEDQVTGFAVVSFGSDGVAMRGRMAIHNMGDSGINLNISGGMSIQNKTEMLKDGRVLQVASFMADGTIGVSGVVESATLVSGSISAGGGYAVAHARHLKDGETTFDASIASLTLPPRKSALAADPVGKLGVGDEIAYRGMWNLGVTVGAVEPNSGVRFSVGASYQRDFLTSVKRLDTDPPTFRVHVEPANSEVDVHAAVAWGPFAITGGGGYASTVFYEFDMTEDALKKFMADEKAQLPTIPDPNHYLRHEAPTQDAFQGFRDVSEQHEGVTLVNFGATKTLKKYLEASTTVTTHRTGSEHMRAILISDGEVLRQDVHTMSVKHSTWLGQRKESTSLSLMQSDKYTRNPDVMHPQLDRNYEGLEATYRFTRNKIDKSDLQKHVDKAQEVMHPSTKLTLPDLSGFSNASVTVRANITPEVLAKLAALDPDDTDTKFTITHIASNLHVSEKDIKSLIADLRELEGTIPDVEELASSDLTVQDVRREQGVRVAVFLEGRTSIVGDGELQRIGAIDRLAGGGVAELAVASTVHKSRIAKLEVLEFLGKHDILNPLAKASSDPWKHFNVASQKLYQLDDIRQEIVKDTLLDDDDRAALLTMVDDRKKALNDDVQKLLADPKARAKILPDLLGAGGMFSGVSDKLNAHFKDPDSGLGIYSDDEGMFDDPAVKNAHLDRVIGMALSRGIDGSGGQDPVELAGLINIIIEDGKGPAGTEQVFKILAKAKEAGVLRSMLGQLEAEDLADLMPRLSEEQRSQLVMTVQEVDPAKGKKLEKAVLKASEEAHASYETITKQLTKLDGGLTRLVDKRASIKHADLMEHLKSIHKDIGRPAAKLDRTITETSLGHVHRTLLQRQATQLHLRIDASTDVSAMSDSERTAVFNKVIGQRSLGEVSHNLIDDLIKTSKSTRELTIMCQAIEKKARASSGDEQTAMRQHLEDGRAKLQALNALELQSV